MTQTAQDIHLVSTAQEYRAWHAGHMAQRRRAGLQGKAADSTTPFDAYINHGRWVVDCPCGAGNATDPAWGIACCIGCGLVHTAVVFPSEVTIAEVEVLLDQRQSVLFRNFDPRRGETPATVADENRAHSVIVKRDARVFDLED